MKFIFLFLVLFGIGVLRSQELYQMPAGETSRVSSMENLNGVKGQGGKSNGGAKGSAFTSLRAGETKTLLDVAGAGIIQRIWCTFENQKPEMLRGLRLRMYWDGSAEPAVDVPVGDFFCMGVGRPVAFQSALFSNPEGRSFNCYIPMPFRTGAKVVLTNETKEDISLLFFDVDFVQTKEAKKSDFLYFHSSFNHTNKLPLGTDINLLAKVHGKGRFLGVSFGVNTNPDYKQTWWGEGEVKMYIDGDSTNPTINGTGTEDYIGTGWEMGFFANQYQGCLLADKEKHQFEFYRFHIPDAIYFEHDFQATIQPIGGGFAIDVKALIAGGVPLKPVTIGGPTFVQLLEPGTDASAALAGAGDHDWTNFYRQDDFAVTAYYYLDRPGGK